MGYSHLIYLRDMKLDTKQRKVVQILIALLVLGIAFCAYYLLMLDKAHSTLQNYADFRGCVSLNKVTATSAECTLNTGQTIQLVQINNKWYLDGDGPGVW